MITKNQIAELLLPKDRYIYKIYMDCCWTDCDKRRYNNFDIKKRKKIDCAKRYYDMINFIAAMAITNVIVDGENITIISTNSKVELNVSQYPPAVTDEIMKITRNKISQ